MVEVASRLLAGESLYARTDSVVSANYPPVWYFLLAVVGTYGLDMNLVGRVVELASLLASAVLVALIAHRLGAIRWVAVVAGITYLGMACSLLPAYIGINDPHLTGQALMLSGAWLALRRTVTSLWLGALLCTIAGFTKHSLLPIPVSLTVYLLLVERRAFKHFVLALMSMTAVGLLACTLAWGVDFWNGIAPDRAHHLWGLRLHVERNVPLYLAIVTVGAVAATVVRTERRLVWPLAYLTVATTIGFYAPTVPGASLNHQYDALIALALVLAIAGGQSIRRTRRAWWLLSTAPIVCIVALLANTYDSAPWILDRVQQRHLHNQQAQRLIAMIAGYSGRVACEDAILCIRAGKFSALDFYNVGQALETGALDREDVVQSLTGAKVQAIQFYGEPGSSDRLPPDAIKAILRVYPVIRLQTGRYSLVQCTDSPAFDCQDNDPERRGPQHPNVPDV
jgi:hypothetical protein